MVRPSQHISALVCELFSVVDRLSAATGAASRVCHDSHEVVVDLALVKGSDEALSVLKVADDSD